MEENKTLFPRGWGGCGGGVVNNRLPKQFSKIKYIGRRIGFKLLEMRGLPGYHSIGGIPLATRDKKRKLLHFYFNKELTYFFWLQY